MTRIGDNFLSRALTTLLLALILCAAVIYGIHALQSHGSDAQTVRRCIDERGPLAIWQQPDGRCHNLVELPGGRVGDQITTVGKDGRTYELTSFVPRCGVLCKIEQWLVRSKGAVKTWSK